VKAAVEAARRAPPRVVGDVALIRFHAAQQIHPLIAQQWRARLKDKIVLAANTGYRPGWVHFAARSARGENLVDFLAAHRPPGADSRYGSGHAQATGGALRPADWNAFVTGLGFPDQQVPA
jgi:single-stranded-DNA-specific exonuclease